MPPLTWQYDTSGDGVIDFNEFLEMAKVLVGSRKNFRESLPWKYGSGGLQLSWHDGTWLASLAPTTGVLRASGNGSHT